MTMFDKAWLRAVVLAGATVGMVGCVTPEPVIPETEEPMGAADFRSMITIPSETESEESGESLRSKIFIPSEN